MSISDAELTAASGSYLLGQFEDSHVWVRSVCASTQPRSTTHGAMLLRLGPSCGTTGAGEAKLLVGDRLTADSEDAGRRELHGHQPRSAEEICGSAEAEETG